MAVLDKIPIPDFAHGDRFPTRVVSAAKERGRSRDWQQAAEVTSALIEKLMVNQ